MAGTSLLALIDDIASILDDVSTMTKVATKKTAGVLGDDLALNAEQVGGVRADRELPVVWAVAKGSAVNKVILVPVALVLSQFLPVAIPPLLMVGGGYLCFEGAEKILHRFLHAGHGSEKVVSAEIEPGSTSLEERIAVEKQKIKGAIRTDFILSAEIIVISLSTMTHATFVPMIASLAAVSVLLTIGVYGLVAVIVKLDDAGVALSRRGGAAEPVGRFLLWGAPKLMRFLSVAGTVAMFLVGGGILTHAIGPWHHLIESLAHKAGPVGSLVSMLGEGLTGLVVGLVITLAVLAVGSLLKRSRPL